MKKAIRFILKIPATPLFIGANLLLIIMTYIVKFVEWVYEADDLNKTITNEILNELWARIKKWMTTI
jgi:hypothetical protein